MTLRAMRGTDMEPNLKHDERERNALKQMCGSVVVEWQSRDTPVAYNHWDNRIHCHQLPKGIAQDGRECCDDIGSIQSAALHECKYDKPVRPRNS